MVDKYHCVPELTKAEIDVLVDKVVDPGVFNKTVFLLGLPGYKMIILQETTNCGMGGNLSVSAPPTFACK